MEKEREIIVNPDAKIFDEKNTPIVELVNITMNFPVKKQYPWSPQKYVEAVTDVSLKVMSGETYGIVGESGCGKSTLANTTIGLLKPTHGDILFKGESLLDAQAHNKAKYNDMRREMQMIFQDPFSSLSPRMDILNIIGEPLKLRKGFKGKVTREVDGVMTEVEEMIPYTDEMIRERVLELLKLVGLDEKDINRHASDFSGGQRQRICIARALALNPEYLVCDEPVSALDVSVHAQILNLLMDLQKKLGLTYLFISHNLAVVKNVCSNTGVMYLGKMCECGDTKKIFDKPLHPYTRALMSAVLDIDKRKDKERVILQGDIPSPIDPPIGCRFHQRCPEKVGAICEQKPPKLVEIEPNHFCACHLFKECN